MVDRQNLKNKANSAGKSVAGTLGEAGSKLKSKAKGAIAKDPETGIAISEVGDKYVVIDGDGNSVGAYDSKRNAAAKARELKRESGTSEVAGQDAESTSRGQQAATKFSSTVNKAAKTAGKKVSELGQKAAESVDAPDEEGDGADMSFLGGGGDGGPMLPGMEGDGGDAPTLPSGFGGESDAPSMPAFGGQEDDGDGPTVPSMGMGGEPQSPFGGGMGEPSMPMFGGEGEPDMPFMSQMEDEDSDDDQPRFPWM
jgi:hypothetical protein